MINFSGTRPQADPAVVVRIKQWVSEVFQPTVETTVMVTELRCSEPGCPPLETVIALLLPGQPPHQLKIHKAIMDVTEQDIANLIQGSSTR